MGKTVIAVVAVVAVVAIAIAAPYLAPALVAGLGSLGITVSVAVATALITAVLSIAVSLAFSALGVGAPSAKNSIGPPQVFRQTIANSFIAYGRRRLGGLLVFFHAKQSGDDHYRYFAVACAGHQCKQLVNFLLGDEAVTLDGSNMVTSGKYAGAAWLWFVRGTATDAANSTFVSECDGMWTSAHQGKGVAKIYAKFKLTDAVVQAGMPNITAVVDGRDEIRDSRTGSSGFFANAALVFYDWMAMLREEGGFGAYSDEIPDDSWISAQANVCDESIGGGPRYEINGVITTGATPSEVRDVMIVNQAGTYAYSGGKHLMRPGYWVPPSMTLSEDDLAGPIQVSDFMPSDIAANEIQGTYISPADNYQGMPFPTQSLGATDVKQSDLDLALVTSKYQAQRVALIMLLRAQAEKTVVWPMNIVGLGVAAMGTVQLACVRYGLDNYAWAVSNWGLSADYGAVISVREENADIYADPSAAGGSTPGTIVDGSPVRTLDEIANILRTTYPKDLVIDAIDALSGTATIRLYGPSGTSSHFLLDYPGALADVSVAPVSITGKSFATDYYPYVDVSSSTLLPSSWAATTVYADSLNSVAHPYRVSLNRKVTTPVAGGTTTTGSGTGGGGYTGGGTGSGGTQPQ